MSAETIESPLAKLTDEQIEQLGKEFDAIHDEVFNDLGERDAKYIHSMIEMHRRLVLMGRVALVPSRFRPAWIFGTAALGSAKILENMEIGHNVMHGQWDWMNNPEIHSSTWDWDTASTKEAWKHSHNYVHHTYTNIRGKDKDLGYEIMRIDPHQKWNPVYLLQPFYNVLLDGFVRVGGRLPRPRLRGDPQGREVQGAAARGAEGDRRQGAHPDRQGLHRVSRALGADHGRHLRRPGGAGRAAGEPARPDGERGATAAAPAPATHLDLRPGARRLHGRVQTRPTARRSGRTRPPT